MQAPGNGSDHLAGASSDFESDVSFSENGFLFSGHAVGSSQNLDPHSTDPHSTDPHSTDPHYTTNSTVLRQYLPPENTFIYNGEELQQSSQDWNTEEIFPKDQQVHGNLYLEESLAGPMGSFWSNQSPAVQSSFDQHSVSESTVIQDVPNYATSQDGMGRTDFQCHREECHGSRFAQHSEFQHEDKHNRPFICPVSSCHKKSFADRGGLQRHNREVHKSAKYFCPIPNCKRNKRGFGRKYNLIGHNERIHKGTALDLMRLVSKETCENSFGQDDRANHSDSDGREELTDEEDNDFGSPEDLASPPASSKAEKLKQKLRKLRVMKKEHDVAGEQLSRDIQNVERLFLDAVCNEG